MQKLGDLSNEELLARLSGHVGKGHVWQAGLIAYLAEVEDRRLDREHACSSMWDFCVRKLGMSESEAHRRIAAARVVREFPHVLGFIERGELHLCALYALRNHLTNENHEALLREATGKSTREVEAIIAARFPRPDVPSCIEPVQPQAPLPVLSGGPQATPPSSVASLVSEMRPKVEPLSATRYRVELTVSADTKAKLERIKDLMRHRNPTGDLEIIVDASLGLLLAKLENERLGKTSRPRKAKTAKTRTHAAEHAEPQDPDGRAHAEVSTDSPAARPDAEVSTQSFAASSATGNRAPSADAKRKESAEPADATPMRRTARRGYIARDVRRQVFAREGEQCSYVDAEGNRCPSRAYLELDHVHPKALGGSDDVDNLRVRCRAHNRLYAEQVFGRAHVAERIHFRRRKYGPATPRLLGAAPLPPLETAERALRGMGFRDPEVRRALGMLATKFDSEASIETMLREALVLIT